MEKKAEEMLLVEVFLADFESVDFYTQRYRNGAKCISRVWMRKRLKDSRF